MNWNTRYPLHSIYNTHPTNMQSTNSEDSDSERFTAAAVQHSSQPHLGSVLFSKMPRGQPPATSTTTTEPPFKMFEIMPSLYLSRYPKVALLPDNITHILNMCKDPHDDDCGRLILHIPLDDIDDIKPHMSKVITFIENSIGSGGSVLVHCALGLNRSVAAILAYVCHVQKVDSATALTFLKAKKPDVKPSALFLKQIDQYYGRDGGKEDPLVGFHRRLQDRKRAAESRNV